jgi:hypothetical protein
MVYDPTSFTASKLVIVASLLAYGAVTEPRATCGSRPHGCAARRAMISRLLTKHFYQVTCSTAHAINILLSKNILVIGIGNPQWVDGVVLSQM